jgi:hypothetical protein
MKAATGFRPKDLQVGRYRLEKEALASVSWAGLAPVSISSATRIEPVRVRSIHIAYTALSLVAPRKVLFRYRLQGFDKDWSSPVSLRQGTYTNLSPGKYEFQVIACNNDGVWNTTGDMLGFVIPPAFYQAIWFWCLVAAAVICAL